GQSLLELIFQTLGRDVMFCLNLRRDLDPDPLGLEADDLDVVGYVLPVRMVIALAFFKRIFTRSLPMNQAHGLIIGDVCGTCCVSTNTMFWGAGEQKTMRTARTEMGPLRATSPTEGRDCGPAKRDVGGRRQWVCVRDHDGLPMAVEGAPGER